MPIYRDARPVKLAACWSWFDCVAVHFYEKLASVAFVIDRQEELLKLANVKQIQRAWLTVALSDYADFVTVFEFFMKSPAVRELYGGRSYIYEDAKSLQRLKLKYLDDKNYDFFQPENVVVRRYAKFLFDNYVEEVYPEKKEFLRVRLGEEGQVRAEELVDYDREDFDAERAAFLRSKAASQEAGATEQGRGERGPVLGAEIEMPDLYDEFAEMNEQQPAPAQDGALQLPSAPRSKVVPLLTPSNRDSLPSQELRLDRQASIKQPLMTPAGHMTKRFFADNTASAMDEESAAP